MAGCGVDGSEIVEGVAAPDAGSCSRGRDAFEEAEAKGVAATDAAESRDSSAVAKDVKELAREGARIGGGGDLGFVGGGVVDAAGCDVEDEDEDEALVLPSPGGSDSDGGD